MESVMKHRGLNVVAFERSKKGSIIGLVGAGKDLLIFRVDCGCEALDKWNTGANVP